MLKLGFFEAASAKGCQAPFCKAHTFLSSLILVLSGVEDSWLLLTCDGRIGLVAGNSFPLYALSDWEQQSWKSTQRLKWDEARRPGAAYTEPLLASQVAMTCWTEEGEKERETSHVLLHSRCLGFQTPSQVSVGCKSTFLWATSDPILLLFSPSYLGDLEMFWKRQSSSSASAGESHHGKLVGMTVLLSDCRCSLPSCLGGALCMISRSLPKESTQITQVSSFHLQHETFPFL